MDAVAITLFEQYAESGGELLICPICFNARKLDEGAMVASASIAAAIAMFDWLGDEDARIFSY